MVRQDLAQGLRMRQISDKVFAEDFLFEVEIATPLLPSPYAKLPYLVIENFLDGETCREIIEQVQDTHDSSDAQLRSATQADNQKIRKTKIHTLSSYHQERYDRAFDNIRQEIEHFFSLSLTQATKPQVLEYTADSFYRPHSDDSSVLVDKSKKIIGFKQVAPTRKITTLLFVSEHCESDPDAYQFCGGELSFSYFKNSDGETLLMRPKMGTLIVFGSNPIYTHEVKEVTDGFRVTVAQWHDGIL